MPSPPNSSTYVYPNGRYLRHRLLLSTLANRSIRFQNIRSDSQTPGLAPSEISFIRLLDKLTSGTTIHINDTGTTLFYRPGQLLGGSLSHNCHPSRGASYYLQPILLLAPFCKNPLSLTLHGPTHALSDSSMDAVSSIWIPLLRRLTHATPLDAQVKVVRRGFCGKGNEGGRNGEVKFSCGVVRGKLKAVDLMNPGVVKRVRGLAVSNRTSMGMVMRMVDATRGGLNRILPDVYVHTDARNDKGGGVGFGIGLVAETTEGCLMGGDWMWGGEDAEDVAKKAVGLMLEEVSGGGCVGGAEVWLAVGICAVAEEEICRVRVGRIGEAAVEFMRDVERLLGVRFAVKVEESEEEGIGRGIVLSCVGIGVGNLARKKM